MKNFAFALTAQFFLSLVNSMALVASATVAEVWFPRSEMVLSTTFTSLANFMGVGVGLVMPPYLDNVELTLMVEAGFGVVFLVAYVFLAKKDPTREPHVIACIDIAAFLLRWRETIVLLMCGAAVGTSYTIIGLFQQILSRNNYDSILAGWAGLVLVAGGVTGGLIATLIVARYHTFLLPLRIYIVLAIIAAVLQCVFLDIYALYLVLDFIFGIGLVGFVPLAVRMGVIAASPLDESIPTNVMFTSAQVFSLVFTYPIIYFQQDSGYSGMWGIALCTVLSFAPLFWFCDVNKDAGKRSASEKLVEEAVTGNNVLQAD
jgi:hypothetical protein